jgi:hypothetical protein
MRTWLRYNSGQRVKTVFSARLPIDVLNSFPRGRLQIQQGEMTYGLRVMRYISPHGDLLLVTHDLLEGEFYGGVMAVVDMGNVGKRYLKGDGPSRDTHRRENIQENDRDGRKDELLTESGFEIKQDKTHGFAYGITG